MRSHLSFRVQLTEDLLEPLVRRSLAGDRRAWSDLWCALDPFIEKIAGRYRATSRLSASEDERRNVVVRVMERLHADDGHRLQGLHEALLRRDGSFRPWLSTVTMNAAISYTREHPEHLGEHDSNDPGGWVNFEPLPDELDEQLPVSIRAVKMIEAHRIQAYVEHHLEPQQRDALRLWLLGYDHDEIAEAFQLAGAHAADLLVRGALKILRHRFAGGDSPQKKIDQAGLRIGPNLRPVSTWSHEAPARCRRQGGGRVRSVFPMGLRRLRAVFGIDTEDVDKLVDLAIAIVAAMKKAQSTYSAPNPPLNVVEGQIEDVVSLKPLVRNKTPGASATLRKKRLVLLGSLESERLYVQTLADAAPSQEDAMAIIQNAALKVGEAPVYARGALEVKQGQLSGSVDLAAHYRLLVDKPKGRRNFIWEYSTNGGQTWIRSATTPLARHTIANLPPLTVCEFRVALHDRNGQSAWSPVVSFIVH